MSLFQSVKLALKQLLSTKFRTFLTMLGIIIGVFSVILLVSIGEAISKNVSTQLGDMGSNLVSVSFYSDNPNDKFTYNDAKSLLTGTEIGSPEVMQTKEVRTTDKTASNQVTGITEDYASIKNLEVISGRFCSNVDVNYAQKVTVIGSEIAKTYFNNQNPVGKYVQIAGSRYVVIGVLKEKGESLFGSADKKLFIPITSAERLFKKDSVDLYYIQTENTEQVPAAVKRVEKKMNQLFSTNNEVYTVVNQQQALDTFDSITGTLTMGLGAIAGISLLVGGIGIMNIMLVSVSERTREIGIRKAIGAGSGDILIQFLIEAIVLSLLGGGIGILLGVFSAQLITAASSFEMHVSAATIFLAVGFSMFIGVVFGVVPARKASKKMPIDALRAD
ncbi:FtsX-like permease family protein [Listeria monocytogenes]|uniref:ABC transporter permease n=1 Tax=Listeria monocytogenes TaxID=1639 RepID=UPI00085472D9|nr:ABC transporter permease [Listeria monocytogenes]EAC6873169.1 FtsX-like permease family protein [Listeria monocytogenes]EAC7886444.1 FtsX-like permease family protein [Listeria monocytogenes]EAC8464622.1 FtsX-like permease family protein [Listeria monocytogenes]EAD1932258.1 FtsX-like permease family protein [Listeria monocytogenes]EAD7603024.1 FtsX-like permease family protein [Listeria monocytogenes]